jgi:hypothetical protein
VSKAAELFDLLRASAPLTIPELHERTGWTPSQMRDALAALRKYRRLASTCVGRTWRYEIRRGADRPQDRTAKPKASPKPPKTRTPSSTWWR